MPATVLTPAAVGTTYAGQIDSLPLSIPLESPGTESLVLPTCEIEVLARDAGKEVSRATTKVKILPDLHEFREPRPRPEVLERLAQAAGGKVLHGADDLVNLLSGLPAAPGDSLVTRQPVWDSPLLWLVMLGLLAIEWSLRRRGE
jgi:hypothetical protein